MAFAEYDKAKIARVKEAIETVPGFQTSSTLFRNIFPIFQDPCLVSDLLDVFENHVKITFKGDVDVVVGLESRGFLLGPLLASRLGCSFVPVRKKGKLPGECLEVVYETHALETETKTVQGALELQKNALKPSQRVIIIDDIIATGGTMRGACQLVERSGAHILECLAIIQLVDYEGKQNLTAPFATLIDFEGD